jgi:hypothetical protein
VLRQRLLSQQALPLPPILPLVLPAPGTKRRKAAVAKAINRLKAEVGSATPAAPAKVAAPDVAAPVPATSARAASAAPEPVGHWFLALCSTPIPLVLRQRCPESEGLLRQRPRHVPRSVSRLLGLLPLPLRPSVSQLLRPSLRLFPPLRFPLSG